MGKNLLSDTDYTKGWDNRFGVAVCVGKVTKIECTDTHANVRVKMADRCDHNGTPLITKPVPVLQVASQAKKSFAIPRLNTNVLMVKLPNGTSNYLVVGSFYTSKDPPPVSDPMLDYVEYDDGSTMQFDASSGELTWKIKGDILWDNESKLTIKQGDDTLFEIDGDFNVQTTGKVSTHSDGDTKVDSDGRIDLTAGGNMVLQAPNITLRGNIFLEGHVEHTGTMHTSLAHTDMNGIHTGAAERDELLARIEALERRVTGLEAQRHGV